MLCWLMVAGSLGAQAEPTERPILPADTRMETLENGLKVVVVPLNTPGLVSVQTWMDVGARDEVVPGTTGYAHFFEHLMFHGSQALPRADRERALLGLAVDENAWTSEDHTVYHALAPAESLTRLLEIEGDRFARLHLQPAAVKREAGAVQGEHRKGQASPGDAVWTGLMDAAFRVHTYGHPVIGLDEDVAGMPDGFAQVASFLDDHYRPERATLVVAGDVDPGEVFATVGRTHGGWTRDGGQLDAPALPVEPEQTAPRRVHVPWTRGETNPRLLIAWKIPAFTPGSTDSAALQLVADLLGAEVSPLHRRLVVEEQLVRELWVPAPDHRSPGVLLVWATLSPDADIASVEAIIREEVASWAAAPSDEGGAAALDRRKRVGLAGERARRALLLSLDSPAAWASAVGRYASYRANPRDLGLHARALGAVTPGAVRDVAERFLQEERMTVAVLASPERLAELPEPPPLPSPDDLTGEPRP